MSSHNPIILTEFPKSGGSWIASMLGGVLGRPVRDIYVRPGFDAFDILKHPWYQDAVALDFPPDSVIKSHELPDSPLIDFVSDYVHLARDGRDVVISKWFYEKDFCLKNELSPDLGQSFDDYLETTARQWSDYVEAWNGRAGSLIHYERFLTEPVRELRELAAKLTGHNYPEDRIQAVVADHTKEKFAAALKPVFKHNTFVRKGVAGDWKNHFSERNIATFKAVAGETLILMGYESDLAWHH